MKKLIHGLAIAAAVSAIPGAAFAQTSSTVAGADPYVPLFISGPITGLSSPATLFIDTQQNRLIACVANGTTADTGTGGTGATGSNTGGTTGSNTGSTTGGTTGGTTGTATGFATCFTQTLSF